MNVETDELLVQMEGPVATVTLHRPHKLNAITGEMLARLNQTMDELSAADEVAVIVVTGSGRAFCAGADLGAHIPNVVAKGGDALHETPTERFFSRVHKPIIAAVNGLCVAGGTELLLGTDIRIAVRDAWFGLTEVCWGLVPSGGSHVRLPRQVPWAVAMEMILTGERVTAERAYQVGLINQVVESPEELMARAMEVAGKIARNSPLAVRTAKAIALAGLQLETPFRLETALSRPVVQSADATEGFTAFQEGRAPKFQGR